MRKSIHARSRRSHHSFAERNVLAGILEPTSGDITLLSEQPRFARANVGYLTQQFSLFVDLSIDENLRYIAGLRDVSAGNFAERSLRYLALIDLGGSSDRTYVGTRQVPVRRFRSLVRYRRFQRRLRRMRYAGRRCRHLH